MGMPFVFRQYHASRFDKIRSVEPGKSEVTVNCVYEEPNDAYAIHADNPKSYRIGLISWPNAGGIGDAIAQELKSLGHRPICFSADLENIGLLDRHTDIIFMFGPFGKFLHIFPALHDFPFVKKPIFVFWNTEGLPDLHIPWGLLQKASLFRSWVGRLEQSDNWLTQNIISRNLLNVADKRFTRFRYLGDFLYAHQNHWVDVFADISAVYVGHLQQGGLDPIFAPFGGFEDWYEDLQLERDIDVLWIGKHGTSRRGRLLKQVRQALRAHGVDIYMVDNIEHPFVFGEDRTQLFNRSKITLNLLRTWYDENSLRMSIAMPNRSMVVSEPLLPHVPQYKEGVHYVSSEPEKLAETILYYLHHDDARQAIVDNAYELVTGQLTMQNSVKKIVDAVEACQRAGSA